MQVAILTLSWLLFHITTDWINHLTYFSRKLTQMPSTLQGRLRNSKASKALIDWDGLSSFQETQVWCVHKHTRTMLDGLTTWQVDDRCANCLHRSVEKPERVRVVFMAAVQKQRTPILRLDSASYGGLTRVPRSVSSTIWPSEDASQSCLP